MTTLPTWITDPALTEAWVRIRDRFEKAGLVATGRVQLTAATRDQRHALGSLLGRSITRSAVRIDLSDLDQRLRDRSGIGGLQEVLTNLHGQAPQDRPAARAQKNAARQVPLDRACELVRTPWASAWVDSLRRTGLLTGREDAVRMVEDAASILNELVVPSIRQQSRVELAARLLGDAHALDTDRLLHRVVLRGLAAATGTPAPESTPDVARLWSRFGVEPDLLSRTCLVLGISAPGAAGERLRIAAGRGDPVHVTEWDLRRLPSLDTSAERSVLVCENPRVLEAIAESGNGGQAVVCTSGEPNLVVTAVLGRLREAGMRLRYHGDFDWPGIGIANRVRENFEAEPWLMTVDDYVQAVRRESPALGPQVVEPSWDADLGAAMRLHDRAVHEESVLSQLLEQLVAPI
jgi:uncharacterized protein (TIGR02679 family)